MKQRKQYVRLGRLLLAVLLTAAVLLPAGAAQAASKKTVYVVTECRSKNSSESYTFEYNSNGLVSRKTGSSGTVEYFYNSKGLLKKMVEKDESMDQDCTWTFSYNKNGQMVKLTEKDNRTGKKEDSAEFAYNSKGRLTGIVETRPENGKVPRKVLTYKLDYSKGLLSKITITMENSSEKEVFKFWYNSKKTLRKESVFGVTAAQKYKFDKNGRITKRTETMTFANGEKSKTVYTYKYKKMKAPKSCTALIREQQSGFLGTGWSFFY